MYTHEIELVLMQAFPKGEVYVIFDENYCRVIVVNKVFFGKSVLERHQLIYNPLMEFILSNKIHSISISAFCPEEWKNRKALYKHK